ncbi:MAG: endo-1,3-alpha-glucanase family glycosylhydrolase [Verrucomicrobiota bacterium JB024]|nr:endo-1,3-alpha-glucanase family glycosylhydrolase [Verrucomicrobiota bacterium JB024]
MACSESSKSSSSEAAQAKAPSATAANTLSDASPSPQADEQPEQIAELRTVENLPVEHFDEYLAGDVPPYPWVLDNDLTPGIDVSLAESAESAFRDNKVTGKGLLLSDKSEETGEGVGFSTTFTPPPDGEVYLGFDFRLGETADDIDGPGLFVELTDADGNGLSIRLRTDNGVIIEEYEGQQAWLYRPLTPGNWYRIGVIVDAECIARVVLFDENKVNNPMELGEVKLLPSGTPVKLSFTSMGGNKRVGTWAVDNILMAGQVDADRTAWLPFKQEPLEVLHQSKKKVFAYFYEIYSSRWSSDDPGLGYYALKTLNPSVAVDPRRTDAGTKILYTPLPRPPMESGLSVEEEKLRAAEDEVRIADAMGLDGFITDFFSYPTNRGGQKFFNTISFAAVDAAPLVDPNFKVIPSIFPGEESSQKYSESDIFTRLNEAPGVYRTEDGRMLFSKWRPEQWPAEFWKQEMADLEKRGIRTAFLSQLNSTAPVEEFGSFSYVLTHWGPRSPGEYGWLDKARPYANILSAPIASHDVRTRSQIYWESANFDTLMDTWKAAIEGDADWAILNTWSDYSEQAMAPSTRIGYALHDLNTYYIQWFKTGQQPEIIRDVLYYSYRIHHTELEPKHGSKWRLVQQHGGPEMGPHNQIALLAFLKEPGELIIRVGDEVHRKQAEAGIVSFKVPLPEDETFTPEFELVRDGESVVSGKGNHVVLDEIEYQNLLYHSGVLASQP